MAVYMLSVHGVEGQADPSAEEMQQMFADVEAYNREVMAAGNWVFAAGLKPRETATVVSVTDGETTTTDGPFAESKEFLGGFWVLRAEDLDEALALATRASAACRAPVEVRPFEDGLEESFSESLQTQLPRPPADAS
ncbi:MAG: YciI family protein [Actinomycetales bacterium]